MVANPVIGADGVIYITSMGAGNDPRGHLFALEPDGQLRWSFVADGNKPFPYAPLLSPDGMIYVASQKKVVYGVNPDGSRRFRLDTPSEILAQPAVAMDGSLYVATEERALYGLPRTVGCAFSFARRQAPLIPDPCHLRMGPRFMWPPANPWCTR